VGGDWLDNSRLQIVMADAKTGEILWGTERSGRSKGKSLDKLEEFVFHNWPLAESGSVPSPLPR